MTLDQKTLLNLHLRMCCQNGKRTYTDEQVVAFMKGGEENSLVFSKQVFENIKPMYPDFTFKTSVHSQFTQGFVNVWIVGWVELVKA